MQFLEKPLDGNVTLDELITYDDEEKAYYVWADNKFKNCLLWTTNFGEAVSEYITQRDFKLKE